MFYSIFKYLSVLFLCMDESISDKITKSCEFLVKRQNINGTWDAKTSSKYKEPNTYEKELVITSQCINILLFSNSPKYVDNINKALNYCFNYKLEKREPIEWWAWRLSALKFSNNQLYVKEQKKMIDFLRERQENGIWMKFPGTFNLTNYCIIFALNGFNCNKTFDESIKWFRKNISRDENGWGYGEKSDISHETFTSNVIMAMLIAGEDPNSKQLQKARRYLESAQNKDGSWCSSELSIKKPTTYATSLAILSLMMLSNNPFNKKVKDAVEYLKKCQNKDGGWPLIMKGESDSYTTFYAIMALKFYSYLKEKYKSDMYKQIRQKIEPQNFSALMFSQMFKDIKEHFRIMSIEEIIDSKLLGNSNSIIKRRREILKILSEEGEKTVAEVIDSLKMLPAYSHLNKRAHMTQIKLDLSHLNQVKLVNKIKDVYFVTINF